MPRVRLVGEDGEQIGIKDTKEALEYAYARNLDLVEVAARRRPSGRPRHGLRQVAVRAGAAAKQARKHQSTINIKEIKFRPKIGDHDYETKKATSFASSTRDVGRRHEPEPGSRDISPFLATLSLCKAGAASPLTSPAERRARFNRVGSDEGMPPLHAVAFQRMRRIDSAW